MSFREYLAGLDGRELIEKFEESQQSADEQELANPVAHLVADLEGSYPGITEFVKYVSMELPAAASDLPDEMRSLLGTGVMAGGLLLAHVLRLEAELEEITGAYETPSD